MGNSYSISAQSAFDYAQKGDTRSLGTLLAEVQRRGTGTRTFVEHRDLRGLTPLMAAAAGGHAETVRLVRTLPHPCATLALLGDSGYRWCFWLWIM